jgi:uncharacterized membrane protein YqhA
MEMKIREPGLNVSGLISTIIGLTVALLIFSALMPQVVNALQTTAYANNTIVAIIITLVPVVFVAGVLLSVFYGLIPKR